jgi:hypothetical protein
MSTARKSMKLQTTVDQVGGMALSVNDAEAAAAKIAGSFDLPKDCVPTVPGPVEGADTFNPATCFTSLGRAMDYAVRKSEAAGGASLMNAIGSLRVANYVTGLSVAQAADATHGQDRRAVLTAVGLIADAVRKHKEEHLKAISYVRGERYLIGYMLDPTVQPRLNFTGIERSFEGWKQWDSLYSAAQVTAGYKNPQGQLTNPAQLQTAIDAIATAKQSYDTRVAACNASARKILGNANVDIWSGLVTAYIKTANADEQVNAATLQQCLDDLNNLWSGDAQNSVLAKSRGFASAVTNNGAVAAYSLPASRPGGSNTDGPLYTELRQWREKFQSLENQLITEFAACDTETSAANAYHSCFKRPTVIEAKKWILRWMLSRPRWIAIRPMPVPKREDAYLASRCADDYFDEKAYPIVMPDPANPGPPNPNSRMALFGTRKAFPQDADVLGPVDNNPLRSQTFVVPLLWWDQWPRQLTPANLAWPEGYYGNDFYSWNNYALVSYAAAQPFLSKQSTVGTDFFYGIGDYRKVVGGRWSAPPAACAEGLRYRGQKVNRSGLTSTDDAPIPPDIAPYCSQLKEITAPRFQGYCARAVDLTVVGTPLSPPGYEQDGSFGIFMNPWADFGWDFTQAYLHDQDPDFTRSQAMAVYARAP